LLYCAGDSTFPGGYVVILLLYCAGDSTFPGGYVVIP